MKKLVVGYIFSGRNLSREEKLFLKVAEQKKMELIFFNIYKDLDEQKLEENIKKCDIVYNDTAEDFAVEFTKTVEALGKKVIDPSKIYYYIEDKWMFYVKCKEHRIPTPETILLSERLSTAKREMREFNRWPLILKRVEGTMGEFVERAENIDEAAHIINIFWKRSSERPPIIAQEYVDAQSYRITVIGNKILQAVLKRGTQWKATGMYAKKFQKIKVDEQLREIVRKVMAVVGIKICGIDMLRKGDQWLVVEGNAEPALDFIVDEHEKCVGAVLDLLRKEAKGR